MAFRHVVCFFVGTFISSTFAADPIGYVPPNAVTNLSFVKQMHLSFGDTTSSLRVGFATNRKDWSASASSMCFYWPETANSSSAATAESSFVRTYDASVWKTGQVLLWDFRFVQLTDLKPGLGYILHCGVRDPKSGIRLNMNVTRFATAPVSNKWSFVAFGDLGTNVSDTNEGKWAVGYTHRRIEHEVLNLSASFVFHYGDIAYGYGSEATWDNFMNAIEPVASRVPWMVSPGNHDIQKPDSGGEQGVPYFAKFWMPQQCDESPFWYSFDHNGVHFISLSTEHEYGNGTAQLAFLESDLKQAAGNYQFIVVVGHRPILSSHMSFGKGKDGVSTGQWAAWLPLFEKYNVDLTLWGHVHAYERAVYNGIPIITSGMAGQSYCCGAWDYNPANWSKYREDSHGYLRVSVDLEQTPAELRVEYIRSDDGSVRDSFAVYARGADGAKPMLEQQHESSNKAQKSWLRSALDGGCFDGEKVLEGSFAVPPTVPPGLCPAKANFKNDEQLVV